MNPAGVAAITFTLEQSLKEIDMYISNHLGGRLLGIRL